MDCLPPRFSDNCTPPDLLLAGDKTALICVGLQSHLSSSRKPIVEKKKKAIALSKRLYAIALMLDGSSIGSESCPCTVVHVQSVPPQSSLKHTFSRHSVQSQSSTCNSGLLKQLPSTTEMFTLDGTGRVVQLAARSAPVPKVLGSNPAFSTTHRRALLCRFGGLKFE